MMKDKKKKKKSRRNKKHNSEGSDSEDEEKKKEKLRKVFSAPESICLYLWLVGVTDLQHVSSSQALEAEDKRVKHVDAIMQVEERKRPYTSLQEVKAPTEEEMEAFRMKRCRAEDPMAPFLGQ